MEPNIPTSFIPKRPLVSEPAPLASQRVPFGILSLITVVVFFGTLIISGGIFLYEHQLMNQKTKMEGQIAKAKEGLGVEFVSDMKKLDNRISAVKSLLQNHIMVTPIFTALQDSTLRSVQYRGFTYSFGADVGGSRLVNVEMDGVAKNYETIALQSEAFAKSAVIRDAVFSNLVIDDKRGTVGFKLRFNMNAGSLSYQSFIDALNRPAPGATINTVQNQLIP